MTRKSVTLKMIPGLLGFEEISEYLLEPIADNPCFFSMSAPAGPAFILTKPAFFFPDYLVQVKRDELANIALEEKEAEVYLLVTVPAKTAEATANLLAPLIVNTAQGLASQLVLHQSGYTTKHFLFPPEQQRSCG
ncbi:MAG: flagellar assembly protein FliW [Dethiobacter sp.]|nr:flagellar assembly protein FliW [Dethiobacter sp.]MBS3902164.1 flagellar assembly protein FliW [Dethiobacter sp.]MBS3989673.1 flagellar assembly protein FliW [Dethiobacter sp.]